MMPAIAPRPSTEPANGYAQKGSQPKAGKDAFGMLLDAPTQDLQIAEGTVSAAPVSSLPGQSWSLPLSLFGEASAGENAEAESGSGDISDETEAEPIDLDASAVLLAQLQKLADTTGQDATETKGSEAPAEQANAAVAPDRATVSTTASVEAGSRAANDTRSAAVTQAAFTRVEPRKSASAGEDNEGQVGSAPRPEVLSAQKSTPAPVAASSETVAAWDAARGEHAPDGDGDEPARGFTPPAPGAPATSPTAAISPAVAAPAPLALDPVEQPALVQAARNVTAAEVEQRGAGATERLTLQLAPVDLGSVTAVLHADSGMLSVELHVENFEAHQRLSHEKEAIGKALRDIGLDVGVITVQQAVQPAQAIDRDQAGNLQNGNGSRHESASWSAGEGRRNDGSGQRDGGSDRGTGSGGSTSRAAETGRERTSGGRYI